VKVIGDIRDATRKGLIKKEDLSRLNKKLENLKKPLETPEDKNTKLISDSIGVLNKALEDNNSLMKANMSLIQSAINMMANLKDTLDKEKPDTWSKIDVDVKRDRMGKIASVEMKRKE